MRRVALDDRSPSISSICFEQRRPSSVTPAALTLSLHLLGTRGADDRRRHVRVLQRPGDRELRQASARPRRRAACSCCTRVEQVVVEPALDHVRRRPGRRWPASPRAAARPGWYLPVSTPCAIGDQTTWPMPSSSQVGHHLGLDDPPEHVVLRLVRDERDAQLAGQRVAARISSARHSETPM